MKRIRFLLITLMILLLLPAWVRSDDPAAPAPESSSIPSQAGEDAGEGLQGDSALFGVLILAPRATEAPEQPVQAELILDFSAYDPAADQEDPLVRYDVENEQVTVDFLRVLRQEMSGKARVQESGVLSPEDEDRLTALVRNSRTEETGALRLEEDLLILTGDGELTFSEGENSLRLEVKGTDALLTRHMGQDDVQVDVVEGFVPAGSGLAYETFDAEAAEALARQYLFAGELRRDASVPAADTGKKQMSQGPKKTSSVRQSDLKASPAGASATGYAAFGLSIVRGEQPVGGRGEYAVTIPLPEETASLTPRGARQKNINYSLYHVHNGQAEQLDVRAEGDMLCFTTPNFSTFILEYTVDFEYVNPETGELYAYSLPGGQETLLSGLLSALGVDVDLSGSEAVFTDPSLLELEPVSGADGETADWRVRSLVPFDTEERLTVTLKNGAEVFLRVTDEQIVTRVMDAKGDTYEITVTWERDARLPYGAELKVSEVTVDDERYRTFLEESAEALNVPLSSMTYSKLFDISVVDENGVECQPESGVTVKIELIEEAAQGVSDLNVVHFSEDENGGATAEALESATENAAVTFETDGFFLFFLSDFSLADRIFNAIIGDRELYENDDIILTGKMPMLGSVEAERVEIRLHSRRRAAPERRRSSRHRHSTGRWR